MSAPSTTWTEVGTAKGGTKWLQMGGLCACLVVPS